MNGKSRPTRNNKSPIRRSNNGSSNGRSRHQSNGRRPNGGSSMNPVAAGNARTKYLEKAKEALSNGDRILAENYFQHADHYNRIIIEAEEKRPSQPPQQRENRQVEKNSADSPLEKDVPNKSDEDTYIKEPAQAETQNKPVDVKPDIIENPAPLADADNNLAS